MARRAVHFLGWDGAPIPRVVDWLRENLGAELHEWTIALPGGRAVRTLRSWFGGKFSGVWGSVFAW